MCPALASFVGRRRRTAGTSSFVVAAAWSIGDEPTQFGRRGFAASPRSSVRWWALLAAGGASRCLAGFRVLSRFVVGGLRVRIDLVGALELVVHLVAGGGRVGATYLRLVLQARRVRCLGLGLGLSGSGPGRGLLREGLRVVPP